MTEPYRAEAMIKSWADAQKALWDGWAEAAKAAGVDRQPYARAVAAWQELAEESLAAWHDAGKSLPKRVAEQAVASQGAMMRAFLLSAEAWQTMSPALAEDGDWQQALSEYAERLQHELVQLPERTVRSKQDVDELWKLYLDESRKLTQGWLEPLSPAEPLSEGGVRDLFDRFWNAFDQTFARGLKSPTIGYSREFNAKVLRGFEAWLELRRADFDYQALLGNIWIEACRKVMEQLVDKAKGGQAPEDFRAFVNLWVATADEVFTGAFRAKDYVEAQGRLLNAAMAYRLRERELLEDFLEAYGLPSRSELDELHQSVYTLRKELRALKRSLRQEDQDDGLAQELAALKAELAELRRGFEDDEGKTLAVTLPLAEYPELTVGQITRRLDGLSRGELERLRAFEVLHKNRKTLLDQLDRKLREDHP